MNSPSISAFFPCYKDETTVEKMVTKLRNVLPKLTTDYEIIVVDDCSPDKSGEIADRLAKKYKEVRVVHHKRNRGYGGALKSGFRAATKDFVFYTDGDAQYDVDELPNLFKYAKNYDFITGTKRRRADKVHRDVVSKLYYNTIKFFFGIWVKDISGDFRIFRKEVTKNLNLQSNSGTICIEMVKKIQNRKYRIKEVPVNHYPREHGDSAYFSPIPIIKTFAELVPLWWNVVLKEQVLRIGLRKKH